MRKKQYKYTVVEYHYGEKYCENRTDDPKRALRLYSEGTHDRAGNMYAVWLGDYERKLYDRDGMEIDPFSLMMQVYG